MTSIGSSSEPGDFSELITAVQQLSSVVEPLNKLPAQVEQLTVSNEILTHRGFWNRFWIIVSLIGLAADIVVSLLIWRVTEQQNCLADVRAKGAVIADADRVNVDKFFSAIITLKNPNDFPKVYQKYIKVRNADDKKRDALGQANSSTCPLF